MQELNKAIDEELESLLIKHRFYSTVIKDILLTINAGALGGSFIQALCCIDYMGLAINPNWETHGKEDYKKYLQDFLGKIDTNYSKYSEEIYAVRCAWIHTYGKAKATNNKVIPIVRYNQSFICQHLLMTNSKFEISVSQFIADLIVSIELFFETRTFIELKNWEDLLFIPRGGTLVDDRISIRKTRKIKYAEVHEFLKALDDETECIEIRNKIRDEFDSKLN